MITRLLTSEYGASLPEYSLMVTLIAMAAILAVTLFGAEVNGLFDQPGLLTALRG